MEKLLIGAIAVLVLLAIIPIKSEPFTVTNMTPVTATIINEKDETQALFIRLVETKELDNSELTQT